MAWGFRSLSPGSRDSIVSGPVVRQGIMAERAWDSKQCFSWEQKESNTEIEKSQTDGQTDRDREGRGRD